MSIVIERPNALEVNNIAATHALYLGLGHNQFFGSMRALATADRQVFPPDQKHGREIGKALVDQHVRLDSTGKTRTALPALQEVFNKEYRFWARF